MHREHPCGNADDGCPNSAHRPGLCDDCREALMTPRAAKRLLRPRATAERESEPKRG